MFFMWLFPILFIVAIVLIARSYWGEGAFPRRESGETPLEIARKRYARGEISREEFEEIKRTLGG